MKVAYIFRSNMASTFQLATMILPQLEGGFHGADVVGMFFNGDARYYGISPQVLSGVIRVTTHPKVFAQPSCLDEVLHFCEVLLFNQASGTGIFSRAFALTRMRGETWYPMLGLLPWLSSPVVIGSR